MAESTNIEIEREGAESPINIERENAIIRKLPAGAVSSVNGKTGDVILDAQDVGAAAAEDLSAVAFSGDYNDLENEPESFTQEDWDLLWQE